VSLPKLRRLKLASAGAVLTIVFDDPSTQNALSAETIAELTEVLEFAREDLRYRALVLRGSKKVFCAGANLKSDVMTAPGDDRVPADGVLVLSKNSAVIYNALNAHPAVVIAVVEGPAYGGGFGVTCCADIVICGPGARFSLSETTLGLVPAQIAPAVVGRIGLRAARRLALTGARFGAADAKTLGLADYVAADDQAVEACLREVLASVDRCAPQANAATKALLAKVGEMARDEFIDYAARIFADAVRGEGAEGILAFREKRPPGWVQSK